MIKAFSFGADVALDGAGRTNRRHLCRTLSGILIGGAAGFASIPGHHEPARPNAGALRPGLRLLSDIVPRVPPIGSGMPASRKPAIQVQVSDAADGDGAAILVAIPLIAAHRFTADDIGKGKRGRLTAAMVLSVPLAELPAFGRIDSVEPNPLPLNIQGVAVDD